MLNYSAWFKPKQIMETVYIARKYNVYLVIIVIISGLRGCGRIEVRFTITCTIGAYHY